MNNVRNKELQDLLERLGRAIHASVVDSDEVNLRLAELHSDGWDAVMFLEASLMCRQDESIGGDAAVLHIHVGTNHRDAEYLLDASDARWLSAIGISPTKNRSIPRRALPPLNQPHPPACDDS